MSRTCQWPAAVGASQTSGAEASASIWSACSRTVRSKLSLLAKSMKSHSLIFTPHSVPLVVAYALVEGRVRRAGGDREPVLEHAPLDPAA